MRNKAIKYGQYALLFLGLCAIVLYIYKYHIVFLDSDASSDLVMSSLLNKNGQIMSPDWYYSTELIFVNCNLVFAPLFSIFNNWAVIRAIGSGICLLLLVLSSLYLYKQLGVKNKGLLACLLLLPISVQYFGMYIAHPFYTFSTIKTFLTIGLLISIIKSNDKFRLKLILISILCFIQSAEGFKNIVLTIIPIILTYIIFEVLYYTKKINDGYKDVIKKLRKSIICIIISCIIGFLVYSLIFKKTYSFMQFDEMTFKLLDNNFISTIINSWLTAFGYIEGDVFSSALLHNGLSILLMLLTVVVIVSNIKNYNKIEKGMSIYTIIVSANIFVLLLCVNFVHFVDGDMVRYDVPIIFLIVPMIFLWLKEGSSINKYFKVIYVVLISLFIICGIDNLNTYRKYNKDVFNQINRGRVENDNYELKEIADTLVKDGYKNGYSYFWHGNILTELSNGQIDMRVFANGGYSTPVLDDLDKIQEWLQSKKHLTTKPDGKVFLLFNMEEYDKSKVSERLDWSNLIYNTKNYIIYGYNSYDDLNKDFYN